MMPAAREMCIRDRVSGGCNVGGIAGKVNNKGGSVLIESCRSLGNVHATNETDVQYAGGILGCGYAEIYNCDSAGTITGEKMCIRDRPGTVRMSKFPK